MNKKDKSPLGIKFYVTACICGMLIGSVILMSVLNNRKKEKEHQEYLQEMEQEEEVEEGNIIGQKLETEEAEDLGSRYFTFEISNRKEMVEPAMGSWAYRINEALTAFVKENEIAATSAECFECYVPDESVIEFYFECSDDEKTLLKALYYTVSRDVSVEMVELSKEEINEIIWSSSGEPGVRDTEADPEQVIVDDEPQVTEE